MTISKTFLAISLALGTLTNAYGSTQNSLLCVPLGHYGLDQISLPVDQLTPAQRNSILTETDMYANGVNCYHATPPDIRQAYHWFTSISTNYSPKQATPMPIVAYRILCLTAVIESQEREFALLEASPDSSTEPESKTKISILADEIYRDKCKVNQLATEIGVSTKAEVYHALSVQHYNNTLSRVPETNPQSPATRSPEDKDYEFNIATYFWQMEGINHRVAYKFAKLAKEMGCEVPQSHIDAARIKLLKYGIYLFRYGDPTEVLTIFKEAGIDGDDLNTSYYIAIHKIFLPCFQDHSYEEYQSIYNNITSYYVPLNDGAQRDFYEAYKFQVLTLGVYFYEKGDREQAANLFGEVGEGGYEEALCRLAQYHQKCGEGDKASPLLDRALASLPEPSSGDYDEDEVYDIKALVVSCMPKVLPKVLSS